MNWIVQHVPGLRSTLLGLVVVFGSVTFDIGCSDSGTVFLDGQLPGDLSADQLAHRDTQAADTGAADTGAADTGVADMGAADTAPPQDAVQPADGGTGFPQALDGVGLVGWMGGINRFSWVRFSVTSMSGGTAIINKGTLRPCGHRLWQRRWHVEVLEHLG